jgi:hypothetical protein
MALEISGSDITTALGGGGGPSPSDPIQDAKILTLESKTQNINNTTTDGTKTTFNNKVIVPELDQSTNLFYVYNSDPTGTQINTTKDNSIPKFDTDGKKIKHSNIYIKDDNGYGSIIYNDDLGSNANVFMGKNQVASGYNNIHIGKNITAGNNNNNGNVLLGSNLKGGNGEFNIFLGGNAGPIIDNTTGNQNISIGNGAGNSLNSGIKNIFIGSQASANLDSTQSIGIGPSTIVRRSGEAVINSLILRPNVDNVCDLGTPSTDPLHVARYKNLYLSGKVDANESTTNIATSVLYRSSQYYDSVGTSGFFMGAGATGTIQMNKTPYQGTTDAIMTLSANGTIQKSTAIADAVGVITSSGLLPSTGNTINIGADTVNDRFNNIASQTIVLNDKGQSNKYYNKNGVAGIDIGTGTVGAINLTGTKYQGHNNSIVTLNGSGQIQQPSDNASVDGNGNITCKNLELLNIASSGVIKAKEIQSNDVANTLSLLNRATVAGKGIIIDATTNGNIQLTGDSYVGTSNNMLRLNTNGTIEKTPITIDGPTNDNITNVITLSTQSLVSNNILNSSNVYSPNLILGTLTGGTGSAGTMNINSGNITNTGDITPITDNTEDIGTLTLSYKDIHIKGDVFKNGVAIGGGGGSIAGISSVDNGGNDIEISFTGSDYLQVGYLKTDVNGRIQVTTTVPPNIEWTNIVNYWVAQTGNTSANVSAILLKNGVVPGTWTQNDTIFMRYTIGGTSTLINVDSWSPYNQTVVSRGDVRDAKRIYPTDPGWTTNAEIIAGRFFEEFAWFETSPSALDEVWLADPNNWTENSPFYAVWRYSTVIRTSEQTFLGSFTGFTYSSEQPIPAGYTRIL